MEFRTLQPDEVELRVGMANDKGFSLLLFKNARIDMQLLDETVGCMNWQRSHEVVDGRLCCTVSIYDAGKQCWVSKQDVGTESQTEKDKGQFSDSFKRACFNVGIGRELYSSPFVWISGHVEPDARARSGYKASPKYVNGLNVSAIEYTEKRTIKKLVIEDADGEIAYSFGVNRSKAEKKKTPKNEKPVPVEEPPMPVTISDEHAKEIKDGLQETDANVSAFLSLFQVASVDEMYEAQYESAMEMIERKRQINAKKGKK